MASNKVLLILGSSLIATIYVEYVKAIRMSQSNYGQRQTAEERHRSKSCVTVLPYLYVYRSNITCTLHETQAVP
jgi:hypothetical protein